MVTSWVIVGCSYFYIWQMICTWMRNTLMTLFVTKGYAISATVSFIAVASAQRAHWRCALITVIIFWATVLGHLRLDEWHSVLLGGPSRAVVHLAHVVTLWLDSNPPEISYDEGVISQPIRSMRSSFTVKIEHVSNVCACSGGTAATICVKVQ